MPMLHRKFASGKLLACHALTACLAVACLPLAFGAVPAGPVFETPEAASADKDFAIQGEYVGQKLGMQVVALGDGDFDLVLYQGGLPGEGWDRTPPQRTEGDVSVVDELVKRRGLKRVERKSPTLGAKPPASAIMLFDGTPASLAKHWRTGAQRSTDGWLAQGATSQDTFQDYSLHIEFRTSFQPQDRGQGRSNSGIYHQGRYETQVLDSFGLEGKHNEAGGIYTVRDPELNMCFPPLTWQTYDIDFTAARFDAEGKKLSEAALTVRLNGVLVQREVPVPHPTTAAPETESAAAGPIHLQDHGNPVCFRNIWLVPRNAERDAKRPRVPAFERFYITQATAPESTRIGGRILLSQLGCTACHASDDPTLSNRAAPLLGLAAGRLRPDHLLKFIASPPETKSGTPMPSLWHGANAEVRARQTQALASYLLSSGKLVDRSGDSAAAQRGDVAFHNIGCIACHAPRRGAANLDATSVPLGDLTAKYSLDSLSRLLLDPHVVRPSGMMPQLVNDLSEARDIAAYLLGEAIIVPGAEQFQVSVYFGSWDKLPDFASLKPDKLATTTGLDLTIANRTSNFAATFEAFLPVTAAGEYRFFLSSDDGSRLIINGRPVVEFDGIHPAETRQGKVRLDAGVHPLRVEYFEKGGEEVLTLEVVGPDFGRTPIGTLITADASGVLPTELIPAVFKPKAELVALGKELFQSIGCANCHKLEAADGGVAPLKLAKPLNQLRVNAGCLAEEVPPGAPQYNLHASQRAAIQGAIQDLGNTLDSSETLRFHLANNNCFACHQRDDFGGPETTRDPLFLTRMPEMGNEGRLPPTLTGVGDKLQPQYLERTVAKGLKERPYMQTRMPGFGDRLGAVTRELFVALDTPATHNRQAAAAAARHSEQMVASGRQLVGSEGLACVKCHTFGQKATPGIQAIDMKRMSARLNADWFVRYMREPTRYRPGTRMPLSFPDGKSTLTTVFDGDAQQQIEAMWSYLAEGEKAREPVGLDAEAIVLKPIERPIIYRNFIEGLGPRGIGVGYPEQTNLAWDAGSMSLSLIWKNGFMDASKHWVGRGSGNQAPLGDFVVAFESVAPVAVLSAFDAAWPTQPARTRDYHFQGYRLNAAGQPTFRYQFADVSVEDQPLPRIAPSQRFADGLMRRLTINISKPTPGLVFRAATGKIAALADEFLLNDQVHIAVHGVPLELVEIGGKQELRGVLPESGEVIITENLTW